MEIDKTLYSHILRTKPYVLKNGFKLNCFQNQDLVGLLKLKSLDELNELIERCKHRSLYHGIKKAYDNSFFESSVFDIGLTSKSGLYILIKLSSELKKYKYLEEFLPIATQECADELIKYLGFTSGFSPKKSSKKSSDLTSEDIMSFKLKKIDPDLKTPNLDIEDKTHVFYDKSVVVTGVFDNFPVRNEISEWIKEVGGKNKGSVSSKTDFVILGVNAGPSKLKTIEKHNIPTFTEKEFLELFPNKTPKYL